MPVILPIALLGAGLASIGYGLMQKPSSGPSPTPDPWPQPQPQPGPQPQPQPQPQPPPPVPVPDIKPNVPNYNATVQGDGVNVRTGPSTTYAIITSLNRGTQVIMPDANAWEPPTQNAPDGWLPVILGDGRRGWIAAHYLTVRA